MRKFWAKIILLNQPADVSFSPSNFNVHGACTEHSWGCSKIKIHKPRLLLTTSYPKLPENPISKIKSLLQLLHPFSSDGITKTQNDEAPKTLAQHTSAHICGSRIHLNISHTCLYTWTAMWVFLKNMKWGICWFFLSFNIYWDLSVLTKQFLYNSALFEIFIGEN